MARRRKLAFWFGFIAIGFLVADILFLLGGALFSSQYKASWDGVIAVFLWLGLPALVALLGLNIGRGNSQAAGFFELILGGLGVILGIIIFVATFETYTTMGLYNQTVIFSILAAGLLLVVSGAEFLALK